MMITITIKVTITKAALIMKINKQNKKDDSKNARILKQHMGLRNQSQFLRSRTNPVKKY